MALSARRIHQNGLCLPLFIGAHVSMYLQPAGFAASYDRASLLNGIFVNKRFKRQAYTKADALEQCMFRVLEIVDPDNPQGEPGPKCGCGCVSVSM